MTLLLAGLFLYTGLDKLTHYHDFQISLSRSPLFNHNTALLAAKSLPSFEILLSSALMIGLLLSPKFLRPGLIASLSLLCLFTIYLIYMVSVDRHLPCSCGGVLSKMTWKQHIFFNLAFIAFNWVAIKLTFKGENRIINKNNNAHFSRWLEL